VTRRIPNPYFNTSSIDETKSFFDRNVDIELLLNALFAKAAQCYSIVGQRKIGKTSLVQHIARPTTIEQFDPEISNYLFVYIDCQEDPDVLKSRGEFYHLLLDSLCAEISKVLPSFMQDNAVNQLNPSSWQKEWQRVLRKLINSGFYVFVILDEFDKVIMQENLLKDGLFGSLRAYGAYSKFAWITCSFRPLHTVFEEAFDEFKISRARRQSESDFFNIFSTHVVRLFEEEDVDELIIVPSTEHGVVFSEEDRKAIIEFGGRFPYFIQRVCNHFFNAHQKGIVDHLALLQQCISEAEDFWKDYWNKLDPEQQKLLYSVAKGYRVEVSESVLKSLKQAALVCEESGKLQLFSKEFGRFISRREYPYTGFITSVGDCLWKQYDVLKIAGRTNHSQVVRAWDRAFLRDVAIKLIYVDPKLKTEVAEQLSNNLMREGSISINLDHQNIGKVYSAMQDPPAIIMQWIEGVPLNERFVEDIPLPLANVVKIGMKLADALTYAHTEGITHRDIKPSNIILKGSEEPILIDFDIARSRQHNTITGGLSPYVGTKEYSAPEQFKHPEDVGPPADIFALGIVLYQALTDLHQRPYLFGNNPEQYNGRLPEPKQHGIPKLLYRILYATLSQEPKQRPSAEALRDQLQAYSTTLGENDGAEKEQ